MWPIFSEKSWNGKNLSSKMISGWVKLITPYPNKPSGNQDASLQKLQIGNTVIARLTSSHTQILSDRISEPLENQLLLYFKVESNNQCSFIVRFSDQEDYIS